MLVCSLGYRHAREYQLKQLVFHLYRVQVGPVGYDSLPFGSLAPKLSAPMPFCTAGRSSAHMARLSSRSCTGSQRHGSNEEEQATTQRQALPDGGQISNWPQAYACCARKAPGLCAAAWQPKFVQMRAMSYAHPILPCKQAAFRPPCSGSCQLACSCPLLLLTPASRLQAKHTCSKSLSWCALSWSNSS